MMLLCVILLQMAFLANCDFNPNVYLTTPQAVKRYGYPSESHVIETVDGYLLTLHRIPGNKKGVPGNQTVFLQHGLLSSSSDWVLAGNKSLAFILADAGYDVWMGNARGNVYSRGHVSLDPNEKEFWDFSFHEMGLYDLPAAFFHITNTSERSDNIIYIGHSMGTTMFYVLASTFPQYSRAIISLMVSLAPTAHMSEVKSVVKYLAPFRKGLDYVFKHLGYNEFLPSNTMLKLLNIRCRSKVSKKICENVLFLLSGYDSEQLDEELLPVILNQSPAGTSTKNILHFSQLIASKGRFQYYDYGKKDNLEKYGQNIPPLYELERISVPVYLIYSLNDWLCSVKDVKRLSSELPNLIGTYEVPFEKFNHIDFIWARDVVPLVYNPLLEFIGNYSVESNYID